MEDLSIVFHRVKRRQDPKLELKEKGIGIIPQDLFALTFLEVLDLSNNKIISLDSKISNLKNLIFLDLSNNQITSLPQAILQLEKLQILNLSNNPLNLQFEPLLKKENQSDPKLKQALKSCFESNSLTLDNAFNEVWDKPPKPKSDRPYTFDLKSDDFLFGSKTSSGGFGSGGVATKNYKKSPSWLDEDEPKEKNEFSLGGDDKSLKK
jgi:hypothetical protein